MFDNNLNDTAVLFEKKMFLKYTIFSDLPAKKDPPSYFKTYNAHLHSATYKPLYVQRAKTKCRSFMSLKN
jgi:hypothetical protein